MAGKRITMREAVEFFYGPGPSGRKDRYVDCPLCGGEKKLNVDFEKEVFHCVKCNSSGGLLSFWATCKNISKDDAGADIRKEFNLDGGERYKRSERFRQKEEFVKESPMADIVKRSATYEALLSDLSLSKAHKEHLIARGFDEKTIALNEYKTVPQVGLTAIAKRLAQKGFILEGVPGFHKQNGSWTFVKTGSGFMIPQRDGYGRIQGFQIRSDSKKGSKYFNLSSGNKEYGTPTKTFCHYRPGKDRTKVLVTEGALKADLIHHFIGVSVLAVPGVNSLTYFNKAMYDLSNEGVKHVFLAYDMDLYKNEHVEAALYRMEGMLRDIGLRFTQLNWDEEFKGLDDYLKAKL